MFDQLPVFGEGRSVYPKPSTTTEETAQVLITVKAAPQPSAKYGDTVCIAGIRLTEAGPEWIRLYPVPFRSLDEYTQFSKYEIIEVPVRPAPEDPRAESFKPDRDRIQRVQRLGKWEDRNTHVGPLIGKWTMCGILRARKASTEFPSLAAVTPAEVSGIDIEPHPGWTEEQQQKLRKDVNQMVLFGQEQNETILQPPPFQAWYRYTCEDSGCRGHRQGVLDWELVALGRNLSRDSAELAMDKIRRKFLDEICSAERGPVFFVGNQAKRPQTYSVLGVYRSR